MHHVMKHTWLLVGSDEKGAANSRCWWETRR